MVLDNKPESILRNTNLVSVEHELSGCATQLALLGEVELARELASTLLTVGPLGGRDVLNKSLNFAWKESGEWPDGIPEDEKSEQSLSELESRYEANWAVGVNDESLRTFDEKGLEACLGKGDQFADASTGASAMAKSQRLARALDISLRLHPLKGPEASENQEQKTKRAKTSEGVGGSEQSDQLQRWDLDEQSADILNQIVARWGANQQVTYLAEARMLWPYYRRGLIANAMDVSHDELSSKGKTLAEAFRERLTNPSRPSHVSSMTMKELLNLAEDNTLNGAGQDYWIESGDEPPKTMLETPASDEDISSLEKRLDITLPHDYKEFLQTTNGFGVFEAGAGNGIYNGYFPDPALHTVSDVKWVREGYFQLPIELLEIPREVESLIPNETRKSEGGDFEWDTPLPLFDRVLEIGIRDIDNLWLVHPGLVKEAREAYLKMYEAANDEQRKVLNRAIEAFAGSMEAFKDLEWCCVKWSAGGSATMQSYCSFRKYLETATLESQETK
ncbi:MAG: hypothetical protein M1820_004410 [Bogoriella megaspora]|nr:MAG: hypothetical protein M1820_004410 [Bogoriella megaspora]